MLLLEDRNAIVFLVANDHAPHRRLQAFTRRQPTKMMSAPVVKHGANDGRPLPHDLDPPFYAVARAAARRRQRWRRVLPPCTRASRYV